MNKFTCRLLLYKLYNNAEKSCTYIYNDQNMPPANFVGFFFLMQVY